MPYGLQAQVYRHLRAARPLPGGRVLKLSFQAMWRHIVQINDETPWHLPLWKVPRRHNPAYSLRYAFFYSFIESTTSTISSTFFTTAVSATILAVSTTISFTNESTLATVSTCTYLYIGLPFVLIQGIS